MFIDVGGNRVGHGADRSDNGGRRGDCGQTDRNRRYWGFRITARCRALICRDLARGPISKAAGVATSRRLCLIALNDVRRWAKNIVGAVEPELEMTKGSGRTREVYPDRARFQHLFRRRSHTRK